MKTDINMTACDLDFAISFMMKDRTKAELQEIVKNFIVNYPKEFKILYDTIATNEDKENVPEVTAAQVQTDDLQYFGQLPYDRLEFCKKMYKKYGTKWFNLGSFINSRLEINMNRGAQFTNVTMEFQDCQSQYLELFRKFPFDIKTNEDQIEFFLHLSIFNLYIRNEKIRAIKTYRHITQSNLKDAKDFVDNYFSEAI
jgi:hypothetical protein